MVQEIIKETPISSKTYDEEAKDRRLQYEVEYHRHCLLLSRSQRLGMDKAEGMAEGELMMQQIIARRMLKKGLEVWQIVEFTGLTAQEIRKAELLS